MDAVMNDVMSLVNDENIIDDKTWPCDLEAMDSEVVVNIATANSFDPLSSDEIIRPSDSDTESFDDSDTVSSTKRALKNLLKKSPASKRYREKPRIIGSHKVTNTSPNFMRSDESYTSPSILLPDFNTKKTHGKVKITSQTLIVSDDSSLTSPSIIPPGFENKITRDRLDWSDRSDISFDTPSTPTRFEAIAASRMHQGDPSLGFGAGLQCVVLSASALALSVANNRDVFSTDQMDTILKDGTKVYVRLLNNSSPRYLDPEEMSRNFIIGGNEFTITQPVWINNGLYPFEANDNENAKNQLKEALEDAFYHNEYNPATDGFLFTFQSYTISFWQKNETYLLFNSHAVDLNGKRNDVDTFLNKARLFHVPDLETLANLLLIAGENGRQNNQYSIHRMRVLSWRHIEPTQIEIENDSPNESFITSGNYVEMSLQSISIVDTDVDRKRRKPKQKTAIPIDYDSASISTIASSDNMNIAFDSTSATDELDSKVGKSKGGRPKKVKRGPKIKNLIAQAKPSYDSTSVSTLASDDDVALTMQSTSTVSEVISESSNRKRGRPKKVTRGPKRQKLDALADANKKYQFKQPKALSDAKIKYQKTHPDVVGKAISKFRETNPEANKIAVSKFRETNPESNKIAVSKFRDSNPEINKETNKQAVSKFRANNPQSNKNYKQTTRRIPVNLRNVGLIGELSGDLLNRVQPFTLKNISLNSDDIYKCPHCRTKLFDEEKGREQWCCGKGRYNVLNLPPLTDSFYDDPSFLQRARAYNNLFAFSALGVSGNYQQLPGPGFMKIQGRTYHRIFDLSYTGSTNPLGFYVYDGNERFHEAQQHKLNRDIVIQIKNWIYENNPYVEQFRRLSLEPSDDAFLLFKRTTRSSDGPNVGCMPTNNEIAAIISTDSEAIPPRSVAVWKIGEAAAHTIPEFHELYEPLHYTLLYPHGTPGYFLNKLDNMGMKLTQLKYYRCLMLSEYRFAEMGRLSEEWLVDMFCRVQDERINYLEKVQKPLRTAPLNELTDENANNIYNDIRNDETILGEGRIIPGRIYLPNTFTGGPRYMQTKYMDGIALVNRLGRPSYFLTFTCNPKWPEILQSRRNDCYTSPVITGRVFKLKLQQLLNDLQTGQYLGTSVYIMYVIEFQKRGLPHAHICFRVEGGGPIQNTDIDKIVRADIPSPDEANGRLRELVLKHMIHGPCGEGLRENIPCWNTEKKKCEKYFPKEATEITYTDPKGFVKLKRNPENKATIKYRNREFMVNDLWVVPYNAAILMRYDAHINLEIASTRKIVKYLFKYMTKGPDEARVAIVTNERNDNRGEHRVESTEVTSSNAANRDALINEPEEYVKKRYLGSCEAVWRLSSFDITHREPNVHQLPVHLEGKQCVIYKQGNEAQATENASSRLLIYFKRPAGQEFDNLTYEAFYEQYIVHGSRPKTQMQIYEVSDGKHFVTKRQRREAISRLYWVTPNRGEVFYLRLLLSVYPCRGYADLLAKGGPDCETFQHAARHVGLANDEHEYENALQEASQFYTGRKLRNFFVLMITNGAPAAILWDSFKNVLSEDYLERIPNEHRAHHKALLQIDRILRKHGSCTKDHGLPEVIDNTTELGREREEYNTDVPRLCTFVESWLPRLSPEQNQVFHHINHLLHDNNRHAPGAKTAVFIDGASGTGKTVLLNVITAHVRGTLQGVVLCTATSGIAALNYEGGCTAHSMFKLPIEFNGDTGVWGVTNSSQRGQLIREASVIIFDEAPMCHKYLVHILDRSLRDLMQCPSKPFGGKVIIFAGDFRQIPPVVISAKSPGDIVQASLRSSTLWSSLHKFSLTQAQRTRDDADYSDFLLRLGSGQLDNNSTNNVSKTLHMISLEGMDVCTHLNDLVDFVFPTDILNDPDECAKRAILTTHNINVRNINYLILNQRVGGEPITLFSIDSVEQELAQEFHLGPDTLNQVEANNVPDHKLVIKKGCVCMIIRNLSFVDRLVNGTKVIVVDVTPRIVTVRKPGDPETFLIPRITFKMPIENGSPVEMSRLQFPLQVCYAMTVHKSQGQTIHRVGVDLRSDTFAHGQLYVALGRVRNREHIKVLINESRIIDGIPYGTHVLIRQLIE